MGREIKFRAWDKKDKRMIVGEQEFITLLVTSKGVFRLNPHHQEPLWSLCEKERFELMEYTGLKDKNGREIYEGDFIQNDSAIGEVEWVQEHCAFMAFTRNPSFYRHLESDGQLNLTEVIGNIYENPELLEV